MRKFSAVLTMIMLAISVTMGQTLPLDFESDYGENLIFGDGGQGEVVSDPEAGGSHGQVLKYVENGPTVAWDQDGPKDWQFVKIKLTDNYIDLTGTDKTISFDVYTTVATGGLIKLESSLNGGGDVEVGFATTGTGWESVRLDFASAISDGNTVSADDEYLHLVFLPNYGDYSNGINDEIFYFDNMTGPVGTAITPDPIPDIKAAVPTLPQSDVTAIFSDTYTAPGNVNYNPGWWQSTEYSLIEIDGRSTMKYRNLNYQGITFDSMDVSGADYLHFDYWTADGTELRASPISQNTGETAYHIPSVTTDQWVSVDIPISYFTDAKPDMEFNDIHQLKFDTEGTPDNFSLGTFYIDNVYFYSSTSTAINEKTTPSIKLYPNPVTYVMNVEGVRDGVMLELYSIDGVLVKQTIVTNGEFSVADLEAGIYFVKIGDSLIKLIKK